MIHPAIQTVNYKEEVVCVINRTYNNSQTIPYISNHFDMDVNESSEVFSVNNIELYDRRSKIKIYIDQTSGYQINLQNASLTEIPQKGYYSIKDSKYIYFESNESVSYSNSSFNSGQKQEIKINGNQTNDNSIFIFANNYELNNIRTMRFKTEIQCSSLNINYKLDLALNYNFEPQKSYNINIKIKDFDAKPILSISSSDWETGIIEGSNDLELN